MCILSMFDEKKPPKTWPICDIVTVFNLELAFVFFTPTTVETGTGYRIVSGFDCSVSHSKVWDASYFFVKCQLNY